MKKLINALDRIAGFAIFALAVPYVVVLWRCAGPIGTITLQTLPCVGAFIFVLGIFIAIALFSMYYSCWSKNGYKLTQTLCSMLCSIKCHPRQLMMGLCKIYNWLTAD